MQARIPGSSQWVPLNVVSIDNFTKQKINLMHVISRERKTGQTTGLAGA